MALTPPHHGQEDAHDRHDHNAPRVGTTTPGATAQKGGPATEKYTRIVYECIVDVVRRAKEALQPAQVGIGRGTADVNTNRDVFTAEGWRLGANPDGPSEKTVWVVKFETESGEPIAILMNYAHRPLDLFYRYDGNRLSAMISHQLNMDVLLAMGFADLLVQFTQSRDVFFIGAYHAITDV